MEILQHFATQLLIIVFAIGSAWWLIRRMLRSKAPAEPADEPFADVLAPLKRNPKGRAGAVALEEPDSGPEDETDVFPPRQL